MRRYRPRICVNPKCGEEIAPYARIKLCPSCRLAARLGATAGGSVLVGVLVALYHVAMWMRANGWLFVALVFLLKGDAL